MPQTFQNLSRDVKMETLMRFDHVMSLENV